MLVAYKLVHFCRTCLYMSIVQSIPFEMICGGEEGTCHYFGELARSYIYHFSFLFFHSFSLLLLYRCRNLYFYHMYPTTYVIKFYQNTYFFEFNAILPREILWNSISLISSFISSHILLN